MKRIFLLSFVCLLFASQLLAQPATDPIRIWADGSSYKYFQDSTKSYVEVFCAFQRADFQFEDKDGRFEAVAFLYAEAFDNAETVVDSVSQFVVMSVRALEDAYKKDVRIFEALALRLAPGKYRVRVTAVDPITKRSGIATFEFHVRDFSQPSMSVSDLELAYDIKTINPADVEESSLVKANRRVLPNPNGYFSNEDSLVYYFAEVYNLSPKLSDGDEIEVRATLRDSFGYPTREFAVRHFKKPGTTAVISDAVPIIGVPGGLYRLQIEVRDVATDNKATSVKPFRVIYSFDQLTPTMSDSLAFTKDDAELMEQVIKYISSADEKEMYRSLDLPGKRSFLAQFWERKNPRPGSAINEFKNEIFRRFAYANQFYSTSLVNRTDGWRTDRGRIYITYGHPDNIERDPSPMGDKPWEIWYYDRLAGQSGGDKCIFVDLDGYGNYRLVHSTIRGEIADPTWEQTSRNW